MSLFSKYFDDLKSLEEKEEEAKKFKFCSGCHKKKYISEFNYVEGRGWTDNLSPNCKNCISYFVKQAHLKNKQNTEKRKEDVAKGFQICKTCGKSLPLINFRKNKRIITGYNRSCSRCEEIQIEFYKKISKNAKRCVACGFIKPFSQFGRNSRFKIGYEARCLDCRNTYQNEMNENRKEAMKVCRSCNKNKKFGEFSKNRSRADGLQSYCKKCMVIKNKQSDEKKMKQSNEIKEFTEDRPTINPITTTKQDEKIYQIDTSCVINKTHERIYLEFLDWIMSEKDVSKEMACKKLKEILGVEV